MSIVVVVKVSEGLVLAADSAATLTGRIQEPDGVKEGVLKTFYNARKLLQIGDFSIGVLTWGNAFIEPRTVESHICEWEQNQPWWRLKAEGTKPYGHGYGSVRGCANELFQHVKSAYDRAYSNLADHDRPVLGMLVAGYSPGSFFPDIWRFILPQDTEVHDQRPDRDGKPDFGASWFGLTEPIVRLHFGRDERAVKLICEKLNIEEGAAREALQPLEYPIPFAQMPLQDAIEYAHYLVTVVVGRYRFVLGPELCGGEIDIAAITQNEFKWIMQKSLKMR